MGAPHRDVIYFQTAIDILFLHTKFAQIKNNVYLCSAKVEITLPFV